MMLRKILAIVEHQSHKYKECDIYLVVNNKTKSNEYNHFKSSNKQLYQRKYSSHLDLGDLEYVFKI